MSQFQQAEMWQAVVGGFAAVVLVLAVFGLLAWSRWLSHKETMRLAELGGDAHALLQSRERWRVRHGILWAVRVLLVGLAIGIFGLVGLSALATVAVGARGGDPMGRHLVFAAPLLLLALAFVVVGAATLIAYALWARRDAGVLRAGLREGEGKAGPEAGEEAEEQSEVGREAEGERRE